MRILLIIDHFGLGGAQRQMANLALGLRRRGHDVEAFVYHPRHRHFRAALEAGGVVFHDADKSFRFSPGPVLALRRLLRTGGFDVAVAFLRTPSLYAEIASLGTDSPPLVVSERSMAPERPGAFQRLRCELHVMAARIAVNSRAQRDRLADEFPWMRPKLRTIPNGVDLTRFHPRAAGSAPTNGSTPAAHGSTATANGPPSAANGSTSATNGSTSAANGSTAAAAEGAGTNGAPMGLRLLALGNTAPLKNAGRLAEALALHHRERGPHVRITWAGRAPASHAERTGRDAARRVLREGGLEPYWQWHPVVDDPETLLARHDALIHPSVREGMSNAVCEALACGRPVLAGRVSDHGTLVGDGVRGFLFDPDDPREIATAMDRLHAAGAVGRSQMGVQARQYAEENLGLDGYVTSWETLLAEVAPARPGLAMVGAFPAPSSLVFGGTRTACDALLDSTLPERTDLTLLDSTQDSIPPAFFPRRLLRGGGPGPSLRLAARSPTTPGRAPVHHRRLGTDRESALRCLRAAPRGAGRAVPAPWRADGSVSAVSLGPVGRPGPGPGPSQGREPEPGLG